ncbi:DNA ligase D [Hydrogenophaga sp. PBL-H3]|uniref:DNA ligase D n=1 Tax=Hydrogenophaga sp. PBL-H3 TaxID=434010 RepID=UPI0013202924|nr:DNA ligase D [Hydrogenophaga sp. PBL-H3]QHE78777.1 DNA ligase D [Hydrogenophaga sp. PBL-H3]QHE83202.1 DNA ligase D [Hydrogenophaga sp. PBL-H3]
MPAAQSARAKAVDAPSPDTDAIDPLARYWSKRNFAITSEPRGERAAPGENLSFVVQKHAASHLHYDFRLELDGVLLSWAVPKGPSFDPKDRRIAIHVEDHPLTYGSFEGTIPPKQYGAGTVIVWDNGWWEPVGDPRDGLKRGKLLFHLHGQKLEGLWELVNIAKGGEKQEPWILFKKRDSFARPKAEFDVVSALPDSVIAKPLKTPATPPVSKSKRSAAARGKASQQTVEAAQPGMPGAVKAALPSKLAPQLATLATGVPEGQWVYEIKFDGYRIMARVESGSARLLTRNGHDWTERMPHMAAAVNALGIQSGWLDGELVVMGANGKPDFNALQKAFDKRARVEMVLFLFDVPFFEGYDLRAVELMHRRTLLKSVLEERGSNAVRFSEDFPASPQALLETACKMQLEGVMAKRSDSTYISKRSDAWLKLKCKQRQEFVVCGFTTRTTGATSIGSLLLGVHNDQGDLVSVGSVGTGWKAAEAAALYKQLAPLDTPKPAFVAGVAKPGRWSKRAPGTEHWVQPKLVAEVEFGEWTSDGQIRHASFVALRTDKPATAIVREVAKVVDGPTMQKGVRQSTAGKPAAAGVKVSNAERVIDPSTGITKLDLVRYYESVAEWMLPHLRARPVALVRAPTGITGHQFFQKHDDKMSIPGIREFASDIWPGHANLLEVPNAKALASAAQMNVIEFHTWNSTARKIDLPDRVVFDLDPGEGTTWQHIQEAAVLIRALLSELQLEAWLKTSGGKGLHVVVPITPKLDYDQVKAFSKEVVEHVTKTIPSRFVAKSGPSNRVGKLFVDYLRNGKGATTAAAYSARARPGLGVSMPVSWEELGQLRSGAHWTIRSAREHLSFQKVDPWVGYWSKRQSLSTALQLLGGGV